MPDISNTCEVPNINTPTDADPIIKTTILQSSLGEIVAQTKSYVLGASNTRYGVLFKTIAWNESRMAKLLGSSNPSDYNTTYDPESQLASEVYIVLRVSNEGKKRELAKALRTECKQYKRIGFFD
tara:strand:- start:8905 stop:9279 length:375 start_codon:yes stop_codon:yes gene_type:complete